ncbi:DUF3817 domain-containing protein [Pengzhenrongella sp.]|uniref:DUF3817 domain-containing protein n=1 Tax=Pengzhenrongella sp. TaxID=2888820 RepID=UPI002F92A33E
MPSLPVPIKSAPTVREPERARTAVGRYRVMAWVTGAMLLIFSLEIALKYLAGLEGFSWIGMVHGFVYMAYLVVVLDVWSRMRWGYGRLITMVLGGAVPVMSFIVERRVHRDADVLLGPARTLEP